MSEIKKWRVRLCRPDLPKISKWEIHNGTSTYCWAFNRSDDASVCCALLNNHDKLVALVKRMAPAYSSYGPSVSISAKLYEEARALLAEIEKAS